MKQDNDSVLMEQITADIRHIKAVLVIVLSATTGRQQSNRKIDRR
jgi:hypothetical protein